MSSSRVCFLPIEGSGGEGMVKTEVWHEIHSRWKLKEKKRAIARAVGRAPLVSTRFDRRQPRDLYSLRMRGGANCHKEARPTDTAKKKILIKSRRRDVLGRLPSDLDGEYPNGRLWPGHIEKSLGIDEPNAFL